MRFEDTRDAAWLKPLIAALQPDSPIITAFETAERVMRETRERDIHFSLGLERWTRT